MATKHNSDDDIQFRQGELGPDFVRRMRKEAEPRGESALDLEIEKELRNIRLARKKLREKK